MKRSFILVLLFLLVIVVCPGQGITDPAGAGSVWPQLRILRMASSSDPAMIIKRASSTAEYLVTPGDSYQLAIRVIETARTLTEAADVEKTNLYAVRVGADFNAEIPYVGQLNVKGMSFRDLRTRVIGQVEKAFPRAESIDFTIVSPAQFDVQVYGEAVCPGIITASPLSRVSDVVIMAQGVWAGASIRQIVLVRDGQSRTIDLFLYGFKGDAQQNPCVRPGDRLFVPHAALTVMLGGAVMYPGSYELVPGETLPMLLGYAGGASFGSPGSTAQVTRTSPDGSSTEIEIGPSENKDMPLLDGDRIRVN